jgi:hypothetical protein
MKTITLILLTFLFASLFVCPARATEKALPESFGKWKQGGGPSGGAKHAHLETPLLKEAGRWAVDDEWYTDGSKWMFVVMQEFRDPTGAYQAYTSELNTGLNPSTVAPLTAAGKDELLALVGSRLVTIAPIQSASDADLRLLLDRLQQVSDRSPLPPIRGYLPDQDMVQGSQKYALGPAGFDAALQSLNESKFAAITPEIGFAKGAEAMLASYHSATGTTETLILVEYPTPQIAEQQLKHIHPILAANAELANATVERRNSLLSLVLSPANAQSAASLRENIKYGIAVTWNEGSHTLTDPPWMVTVKNIFVGTLAFCGIALAMGVAFGGVRVLTKKLFPGKVFDRPEDIEVLQLGLSGKRIDPSDFY